MWKEIEDGLGWSEKKTKNTDKLHENYKTAFKVWIPPTPPPHPSFKPLDSFKQKRGTI